MNAGWIEGRGGILGKAIGVMGAIGMTLLVPTVYVDTLPAIIACFAVSTFAYAAFSTVILNLPADLFPSGRVASASGLGGTGAGVGTILFTVFTGTIAERYSFEPILLGAGLISLVAMAAVLILVRNDAATEQGLVRRI